MSERNAAIEAALTGEWQDARQIAEAAGVELRWGSSSRLYHALGQAVKEGRAQRRRVYCPDNTNRAKSQWRRAS